MSEAAPPVSAEVREMLARPHPRCGGLPQARRDVQGHHAAARRSRGVHGAHRLPRAASAPSAVPPRSSVWRPGASSSPPPWPCGQGSASSPCARRASCPAPPSPSPTSWSTAPPRWRCTPRTSTADDRVLIVDDVLATGGTAEASLQLIRRAGAQVAGLAVLMELGFLGGRERLTRALRRMPLWTRWSRSDDERTGTRRAPGTFSAGDAGVRLCRSCPARPRAGWRPGSIPWQSDLGSNEECSCQTRPSR